MFKNLIWNNLIAGKIAKMFGSIKGYKTQIGTAVMLLLTGVKYFAPIPVDYLPYIDKAIEIVIGATGVALGDKIRRNYEIVKVMTEEVMNKMPVKP